MNDKNWAIYGTLVYEEAYAISLGYETYELHRLKPVIEARRAYDQGTYVHPTAYYIHPDIPKKRFDPVDPSNVLAWDTDLMALAIKESVSSTTPTPSGAQNTSASASVASSAAAPQASPPINPPPPPSHAISTPQSSARVIGKGRSATLVVVQEAMSRVSIEHPPASSTSPAANARDASVSTQAASTHGVTRALGNDMKHVLHFFYGYGHTEFEKIDDILGIPKLHHKLFPMLLKAGMKNQEAELFCDWLLGTLPEDVWCVTALHSLVYALI